VVYAATIVRLVRFFLHGYSVVGKNLDVILLQKVIYLGGSGVGIDYRSEKSRSPDQFCLKAVNI
jgi:hypothetical protein